MIAICKPLRLGQRPEILHLAHELDGSIKTQNGMALIRIDMNLRRNLHLPKLAIDQGGRHGGIGIPASVRHPHRTRLLIKLEDAIKLCINRIALTHIRAANSVCKRVRNCERAGEVDVARRLVEIVLRLVGRSHRACGEQGGKVGSSRHRHRANAVRIKPALCGLGANNPHRALRVGPCALPDGKSIWTGRTIYEIDARYTLFRQPLLPIPNMANITATAVAAAGDENHAGTIPLVCRWRLTPLKIRMAPFVCLEILDICHGSYEMLLIGIRHFALRPDKMALDSGRNG